MNSANCTGAAITITSLETQFPDLTLQCMHQNVLINVYTDYLLREEQTYYLHRVKKCVYGDNYTKPSPPDEIQIISLSRWTVILSQSWSFAATVSSRKSDPLNPFWPTTSSAITLGWTKPKCIRMCIRFGLTPTWPCSYLCSFSPITSGTNRSSCSRVSPAKPCLVSSVLHGIQQAKEEEKLIHSHFIHSYSAGVSYIVTWSLLLWSHGLIPMQIMEFMYGIATSTEVAYYTYMYAKVPKEKYKEVSSFARSAILFGKFIRNWFK